MRLGFWLAAFGIFILTPGIARADPLSRPSIDAPELARLGPYAVGLRSVVLVDSSARPGRTLPVDIWYPATARGKAVIYTDTLSGEPPRGPVAFTVEGLAFLGAPAVHGAFPLVIVSHGYSGDPAAMTWLSENLASKGYVVAAIHHHDPDYSDTVNRDIPARRRPSDIAFVAKALQAQASTGVLANTDPTRVALVGYSMGGYGVVAVAGAPVGELTVPGLRAVVAIAPAGSAEALGRLSTPLMIIAGDRDHVVGYADGPRKIYERAVHADRYLLVFQNGGHNIGMNGAPAAMRGQLWDQDWFEDPVWSKARTAGIQQHMITAFLDRYVKGDTGRDAYLTPDTAISNDTAWPEAGGKAYSAISPGGPGATWKGFAKNHAVGLELHHAEPAS